MPNKEIILASEDVASKNFFCFLDKNFCWIKLEVIVFPKLFLCFVSFKFKKAEKIFWLLKNKKKVPKNSNFEDLYLVAKIYNPVQGTVPYPSSTNRQTGEHSRHKTKRTSRDLISRQ